mmetsp:Transcript_9612/g.14344  ORF Transcript_9612/g.14344 Transcript_9612/m.14344 type:complete len:89 (-) Transcript_9612:312-578(-)
MGTALSVDDFSRQKQGKDRVPGINCLMADGSDLLVLRAVLLGGASAKEERKHIVYEIDVREGFVGKEIRHDRMTRHRVMTATSPVRSH